MERVFRRHCIGGGGKAYAPKVATIHLSQDSNEMQKTVLACCPLLFGVFALAACGSDNPTNSNGQAGHPGVASGGSASGVSGSPAVGGSNFGTAGAARGG